MEADLKASGTPDILDRIKAEAGEGRGACDVKTDGTCRLLDGDGHPVGHLGDRQGRADRDAGLACPDAADFDDIGSLEWDDAILLLRYLFLGLDAPEPPGPGRCGEDPTPDDLPECDGAGCR
ncbi:MAG: hypothetical protein HY721_13500 [Planctomycetes bacterium]|nr:hypothetical protein [Planctomycetota bacterium]